MRLSLSKSISNFQNVIKRKPAMPMVNMELTYYCTQRCLQCSFPLQATPEKVMSFENFKIIIDNLHKYGTQGVSLSGGEPMLHPNLPQMMKYLYDLKFARKHLLSTLYGKQELVDATIENILKYNFSISCSYDGLGENADIIRGGKNVAKIVKSNMLTLHKENQKRKNKLRLGVNIVISNLNYKEVPEILDFIEELDWSANVDIYRWLASTQVEQDKMKLVKSDELYNVLQKVKKSKVVNTPNWLIDGYYSYLDEATPKYCPYLDSPSLGSKFFVQPEGDLKVCLGKPVGNLVTQTPKEIFSSKAWQNKIKEFEACEGCWNTCYTRNAKPLNYGKPKELLDWILK
jgi:MoaA/NifB/PqqE/SkfB family radical SAM enzyme